MNKKIIGIILCVSILTISAIPTMMAKPNLHINKEIELEDRYDDPTGNYTYGNFSVGTTCPASKKYYSLNITEGAANVIKIINRNLDKKLLRLSLIIPMVIIPVKGLDFTIEYKQNSSNESKFWFHTFIEDVNYDENGTFVNVTDLRGVKNKVHNVTVENFNGVFIFKRFTVFRYWRALGFMSPARFTFNGFCDNVVIS